jgi:hypothetical protein
MSSMLAPSELAIAVWQIARLADACARGQAGA